MRFSIQQSLEYCKDNGYPISRATYCRQKRKLESEKLSRLYDYAKNFESWHLERMEELERVRQLMWQQFEACKDPLKKAIILEKIKEIQPYLTAFMDATKGLIEHREVNNNNKKKRKRLESESEQQ
jgi:hypothetical protein